jgi:branched-chain amino acid transport system permease protein
LQYPTRRCVLAKVREHELTLAYFIVQALNGLQYGLILFLVSAGLTLIFGIIGVLNLAHGSFYMVGAYLLYAFYVLTNNFWLSLIFVLLSGFLFGILLERTFFRFMYKRDHLYQILLTFGLILVLNEGQTILFGNNVLDVPIPLVLDFSIKLFNMMDYPFYRIFLMCVCLALALAMYIGMSRTQIGRYVRAASSNLEMAKLLGINSSYLFTLIFAAGVAITSLAGALMAPLTTIFPGIGRSVIIISFVIIIIGGIGSVKGAFVAALALGLLETIGQVMLPEVSAIVPYIVMAIILRLRPEGFFLRAQ